jgi:hypothetical protein
MPKFGEKHHNAKLSDSDVREMRQQFHDAELRGLPAWRGYRAAADLFGVSVWTVRDICEYRTRISA